MDRIVPALIVAISFSAGLMAGLVAELPAAEEAPMQDENMAGSEPAVGIPAPGMKDGPAGKRGEPLTRLACEGPVALVAHLAPADLAPGEPVNLTALLHNPEAEDVTVTPHRIDLRYYRILEEGVERKIPSATRILGDEAWVVPANGSVSLAPLLAHVVGPMPLDGFEPAGTYALALSLETDAGRACAVVPFEFTPRR